MSKTLTGLLQSSAVGPADLGSQAGSQLSPLPRDATHGDGQARAL